MNPTLKCRNNEPAVLACMNEYCGQEALMCQKEGCDCQKPHERCYLSIPLVKLKKGMAFQSEGYLLALHQVKEWCQKMIKTFTSQIDELQKLVNSTPSQILPYDDDTQFYALLTGKSFQEIQYQQIIGRDVQPALVSRLANSIAKQHNTNKSWMQDDIKYLLESNTKQVQYLLDDMRRTLKRYDSASDGVKLYGSRVSPSTLYHDPIGTVTYGTAITSYPQKIATITTMYDAPRSSTYTNETTYGTSTSAKTAVSGNTIRPASSYTKSQKSKFRPIKQSQYNPS